MIDTTKKYKTRNGYTVRLISDKGPEAFPVVGIVDEGNSTDWAQCWTADGKVSRSGITNGMDLIEVKEKKVLRCWVNFYREYIDDDGSIEFNALIFYQKEDAERHKNGREGDAVEVTKEVEV